jgi:drug/metabolite transporter (DMT)-like permease
MRDWGAGRVGTYAFISPVVAVLVGILVAGERVGLVDALGMALMLGAAFLALHKPAAEKAAEAQAKATEPKTT